MWNKMKRNMEWLLIVALLVGAVMAVGCGEDRQASFTVDAGPDQTVTAGTVVTIAGTSPDGGRTNERWEYSIDERIEGVRSDGKYIATTDFFSIPGKYEVTYHVFYPEYSVSDTVIITVLPVISAGPDQTITAGSAVTLTGMCTDAGRIDEQWGRRGAPDDPFPAISSGGQYVATLTDSYINTTPGTHTVWFTCNYAGTSAEDDVVITVLPASNINTAPVANAGTTLSGTINTQVLLSGSGSDADNDPFTYKWTLANPPTSINSSTPTLYGADTPAPYFTPVESGTYTATLIVNDGKVDSAPSTVTVTVPPPSGTLTTITALQNALANNAFLVFFNNDFLETIEFGQVGGNMTFTYMMPSWYPSHYGNTSIQRTGAWTVADAGGFAQATENAGPRTLNTAVPVNSTNTLLMTGYMSYNNTSSMDIETWIKAATLTNATLFGHKLSAYVDVYTLSYQFNADGTGVHVEDIYSHPFTWAIDASSRKVVVTFTGVFTDRNGVVNSKHNLFMTERHKADVGKREFGVVKFGNSNALIGGIMLLWDWQ